MERIETYHGVEIMGRSLKGKLVVFPRYHPWHIFEDIRELKFVVRVLHPTLAQPVKLWHKIHYLLKLLKP